jgi:hypothetical protein
MINVIKDHLPCFPLAAAQSLVPYSLESSQTTKHLNSDGWKQARQTIQQIVSKY